MARTMHVDSQNYLLLWIRGYQRLFRDGGTGQRYQEYQQVVQTGTP